MKYITEKQSYGNVSGGGPVVPQLFMWGLTPAHRENLPREDRVILLFR